MTGVDPDLCDHPRIFVLLRMTDQNILVITCGLCLHEHSFAPARSGQARCETCLTFVVTVNDLEVWVPEHLSRILHQL